MSTRYYVLDEHTLGYVYARAPQLFGVLHGSVLKGGRDWKNGPVWLAGRENLRPATAADFVEYRVTLPPDFVEPSDLWRVRRSTDGQYLARDRMEWTADAALAWNTDYPPSAAETAFAAQSAADHAFFAEVVPACASTKGAKAP